MPTYPYSCTSVHASIIKAIGQSLRTVFGELVCALCNVLTIIKPALSILPKSLLRIGAALLVIGTAVFTVSRLQRSGSGSLNPLPYEYMGKVAADETARLTGNRGKVAVWRLRLDNKYNRTVDAAVSEFKHELRKFPDLTVVAIEEESVSTGGDLPVGIVAPSPARFLELVERYKQADALVLVGGVPTLDAAQIKKLPKTRPRIVMASIFNVPGRNLLEHGVAQVVIAPRDHPPAQGKLESAAQRFDYMYVVLTPETAATLRR